MRLRDEHYTAIAPPSDPYFARRVTTDPRSARDFDRGVFVNRDYYGIYLIVSGTMDMDVVGSDGHARTTRVEPGRIYLWRPQDHRPLTGTEIEPIVFYEIGIRAAEWHAFATLLGIPTTLQTAPAAPAATVGPGEERQVLEAFDAIVRSGRTEAVTTDLIPFLVAIVPRLYPPVPPAGEAAPPWLFESVAAMREEQNLRIGMHRFLELARVSSRQLARTTHRFLGATPGEILAEARIQHAMRLLRLTSTPIAVIADRCGYASASYFANRFRLATGATPRTFRRRSLQGFSGARTTSPD